MNPLAYALATYGITAVISLLVVMVVLVVNGAMQKFDGNNSQN